MLRSSYRPENDDDSSSGDDSYTTTESESEESEQQFPTSAPYLMGIPLELRYTIIDMCQQDKVRHAVLAPTAMVNMNNGFVGPLPSQEETLLFCTRFDPIAAVSKELHMECTDRLRAKILDGQVRNLRIHVLDFDFSLALSEFFVKLGERSRARLNNDLSNLIKVRLTFTPGFALLPHKRGIEQWLEWREQEKSAGRHVEVDYVISKETTKGRAELESLRQFTLLFDSSEGESGEIISAMKKWYLRAYRQRKDAKDKAAAAARETRE